MRIPKYRHHKSSKRAVVRIGGKDRYLGAYGSAQSKEQYRRLVGQYLNPDKAANAAPTGGNVLLVKHLILAYVQQHVDTYYRKHGQATSEEKNIRTVIKKYLRPLYGDTPAEAFGVLQLQAFWQELIDAGLARKTINEYTAIVRRMYRWAAQQQMVSAALWHEQRVLAGLARGRSKAKETQPVEPVPQPMIDATLAELSAVVADMARLQLATGCRPGEVCMIRPCDVDRSGEVWEYRPESHKTEHHGRRRVIFIGAVGQKILTPYLLGSPRGGRDEHVLSLSAMRPATSYCFAPEEASGQFNKQADGKRLKRACYDRDSYRRAIHRACDRADKKAHEESQEIDATERIVPRWSPNRLRHNAATAVRKHFGLEASQCVLGHASAKITEVYAERDEEIARRVMKEMG